MTSLWQGALYGPIARLVCAASCVALCIGALTAPANPESARIPAGMDYGAGLSLQVWSELGAVVANPEQFEGREILLRGRISDVCQRKGCWTVLSEGDDYVRVRFKDYGFFLPKDSRGKLAFVEGRIKLEKLSAREADHYAEESQTHAEESQTHAEESQTHAEESQTQAEESQTPSEGARRGARLEIGFTASGVRLIDAD